MITDLPGAITNRKWEICKDLPKINAITTNKFVLVLVHFNGKTISRIYVERLRLWESAKTWVVNNRDYFGKSEMMMRTDDNWPGEQIDFQEVFHVKQNHHLHVARSRSGSERDGKGVDWNGIGIP